MTWFMTGRALRPVSAITGRVQGDHRLDARRACARAAHRRRDRRAGADDERNARPARRVVGAAEAVHVRRQPRAPQSGGGDQDPARDRPISTGRRTGSSVARTVLDEDERLESLVGNLLALARLEEGSAPAQVEVDLDEVVHEQTARPARVPVDRSGVLAGRVSGVPTELTSVVRNLIDNARAARVSRRCGCGSPPTGPGCGSTVDDDGPGSQPADRAKVFERFARLQEGRSPRRRWLGSRPRAHQAGRRDARRQRVRRDERPRRCVVRGGAARPHRRGLTGRPQLAAASCSNHGSREVARRIRRGIAGRAVRDRPRRRPRRRR